MRVCGEKPKSGGNEDEVADTETRLGKHDHGVNSESTKWAADGEAEIAERVDFGEAQEGFELAARLDEEHHAVVGEECDGEEHEETHHPTGSFEAVG